MEGKGNMDKLIICETDRGRYVVRPMSWAGIWNEKGQIKESLNHLALFIKKEDAEKFVEWENAEEQGKLLKLPCKLGDITFWTSDEDDEGNKIPTVRENTPIVGIAVQEDGFYILFDGDNEYQKVGERWAFLTREEAEAALKELERGKGE